MDYFVVFFLPAPNFRMLIGCRAGGALRTLCPGNAQVGEKATGVRVGFRVRMPVSLRSFLLNIQA